MKSGTILRLRIMLSQVIVDILSISAVFAEPSICVSLVCAFGQQKLRFRCVSRNLFCASYSCIRLDDEQ